MVHVAQDMVANLVLNDGSVWDTRDSIIQMSNNTNNISYNLNQINNLYNEVNTMFQIIIHFLILMITMKFCLLKNNGMV